RDPLIGRSVLVAVLAGAILFAWDAVLGRFLLSLDAGAPIAPADYPLDALLGQRQALGWVLDQTMVVGMAAVKVLALVVLRRFVKYPWLAMALTLCLWVFLGDGAPIDSAGVYVFRVLAAGLGMIVLLRWGVVALVASELVRALAWSARSSDWSAWTSQPALFALLAVTGLVVYGAWAATGDRTGERPPARV
ncbi:hypothetical protein K8I85_11340, partial [bacterium]|nr:hypothetical protein [bacterium]